MKFYIVDDHPQIIRILESIIEEESLGEVIGTSDEADTAFDEIPLIRPDIVLIDMLMPQIDGARIVHHVKDICPQIKFIMISQVDAKSIVEKAYDAGVEFFIHKPINRIEITRVIRQVSDKIRLDQKINQLKHLLGDDSPLQVAIPKISNDKEDAMRRIKIIFSKIGIMGEKGGDDILRICDYLIQNQVSSYESKASDIFTELADNPKAMEQRIRRAINRGLVNLANLGIEDYMNETFMRYSSTLYDFESVKAEMDFIRGKRKAGGKISVRKFVDNLLLHKDL